MFTIVLEASKLVVNNRYNFHRKSIEHAEFCDLNHFCRTVIHQSTFGKFQKNQPASQRAETFLCPELPSSKVGTTIQWGASRGFSTTGNDDVRCDEFVLVFYE